MGLGLVTQHLGLELGVGLSDQLLSEYLVERGFNAVVGGAEAGFAHLEGVEDTEVDVLSVDLRHLQAEGGFFAVGLGEDAGEVGRPGVREAPAGGSFAAGEDVGEDLGDRGAAVDLLPLLHQRSPDALLKAALFAEAAGRVAHQDRGGPAGGSLQVFDEGVGGGGDVGQGAVEEVQVLFGVDDHAAVDGAAEVVGLEPFA